MIPQQQKLKTWQKERQAWTLTVRDEDGDPVDLNGVTLRFLVHTSTSPPKGVLQIEDGEIDRTGPDSNIAVIHATSEQTNIDAGEFRFLLWDLSNQNVIAHGELVVLRGITDF